MSVIGDASSIKKVKVLFIFVFNLAARLIYAPCRTADTT